MSHATESLEHAEHAAHGAHAAGPGKLIGLTMALLGVLLAFCAAEVGAQRTELTKAMVEQTQVSAESQANQMKYRLVMMELEKVRASMAQPGDEAAKGEKGEATPVADPVRVRTLDRLLALVVQYIEWKEATKSWVKIYDPVILAHADAAEGFERSALAAEVGIVLASIALLLNNRRVWAVSILMAVLSVGLVIRTFQHSHHAMTEGEHAIEAAKEKYAHVRRTFDGLAEDAHTIDLLDPGGKRRAAITAEAVNAHKGGEHKGGEHKGDEHKGDEHK